MYFQLVDNQVLSTQGQPDVFNLHRLTARVERGVRVGSVLVLHLRRQRLRVGASPGDLGTSRQGSNQPGPTNQSQTITAHHSHSASDHQNFFVIPSSRRRRVFLSRNRPEHV